MSITTKSWSDKYLTIQTVAGLVGFVFAVGVLYSEFKAMKIQADALEKRSDTRYERAVEWTEELKQKNENQDEQIKSMHMEISYNKGFIDGMKSK